MRAFSLLFGRNPGKVRGLSNPASPVETYSVGLSATNAAGTGRQILTISILRPNVYNVALSATNAAGTGAANLAIMVYA